MQEGPNAVAKALLGQDVRAEGNGCPRGNGPAMTSLLLSYNSRKPPSKATSLWPSSNLRRGLQVCQQFWDIGGQGLLGPVTPGMTDDGPSRPPVHVPPLPGRRNAGTHVNILCTLIQPQLVVINLSEAHLFLMISLNPKASQL